MWILYWLGIKVYHGAIYVVSLFNEKAKNWLQGRKDQKKEWKALQNIDERRILFHCASLGEFEQGRPALEALRKEYPSHKIVLTFFSPSGYEIKKNTDLADYVFYLPLDGPNSSKRFIKAIKPDLVFFVKYEFWYFYGRYLAHKKIPFYCISAIFRPGQIYFKFYGIFFKKMLLRFTHLFVQDQASLQILYKHSIARVTVTGDTRFDRVADTASQPIAIQQVEQFCSNKKVFVAGSTWPEDHKVLLDFINSDSNDFRFIIAPHEIKADVLAELKNSLTKESILFSEWKPSSTAKVMIIDNIGMLSKLYKYATFSYVGGGFGSGIHNILETVVFGNPVFIGPNYQKFLEAVELVKTGGAIEINSAQQLQQELKNLLGNETELAKINAKNKSYVSERKGATQLVMNYLSMNFGG
jgi:3-deoxy-D-manno-octulosonic-acid transferase